MRTFLLSFFGIGALLVFTAGVVSSMSGASEPTKPKTQSLQSWADFNKLYVKANVLARLKDPDSAIFTEPFVHRPTNKRERLYAIVCGEVNARNGFGGYSGMKGYVTHNDHLYIEPASDFYAYWNRYCVARKGNEFL